jgi:hypothetical protein
MMGSLDSISWFSYVYIAFMLIVPAAVFISVFSIFFKKTKCHPSGIVRMISKAVFIVGILGWIIALVMDAFIFIKKGYTDIDKYNSYNLLFIASNGFVIFLIGIIQALTTEKEKDWMDKYKDQ